jgi:predicted Zn-dependent protease
MRFRLVTILLIGFFISGCSTNPVTGKSELTFVSEDREIAIGSQQYLPAQQSQGGLYQIDQSLTDYVNEVGSRLAAVSDRALPYEFVVLNDSTPNAWALPGGKIAVNRGLLMSLENEAELAAVLGHEIVHAAARHGARSMERGMLLQGALVLTAIGTQNSEYSNYIVGGASLGAQLISTRYGRQAELEADEYGMAYMARAGYDPAAAISLQEKFVALKEGQKSHWLQGLFASHPPSEERVAKNAETSRLLKEAQTRDWETGNRQYAQRLNYLVSKEPAYAAFDQAMTLLADKETSVAKKRVEKAIQLEPREPKFYGLKADILYGENKYRQAISQYGKALEKDSQYYEYYLGRGMSYSKLGNTARAKSDLERSNQLLPTALATNELGTLALRAGDRETAKKYFSQVAGTKGTLGDSARHSFIQLDIRDNPANYFNVTSENRDGRFYSVITNASGLNVKGTTVYFSARINGETKVTRRRTGPVAANTRFGVTPGWKVTETDVIDNVDVRVIEVTL